MGGARGAVTSACQAIPNARERGPRKAIVRRWTRPSPIGLWAARRPAFSSSQGRCAGLLCALRQSKKTEISSGCSRSPPAVSSFIFGPVHGTITATSVCTFLLRRTAYLMLHPRASNSSSQKGRYIGSAACFYSIESSRFDLHTTDHLPRQNFPDKMQSPLCPPKVEPPT